MMANWQQVKEKLNSTGPNWEGVSKKVAESNANLTLAPKVDQQKRDRLLTARILADEAGIDFEAAELMYPTLVKKKFGEDMNPGQVRAKMEEEGILASPKMAEGDIGIIAEAVASGKKPDPKILKRVRLSNVNWNIESWKKEYKKANDQLYKYLEDKPRMYAKGSEEYTKLKLKSITSYPSWIDEMDPQELLDPETAVAAITAVGDYETAQLIFDKRKAAFEKMVSHYKKYQIYEAESDFAAQQQGFMTEFKKSAKGGGLLVGQGLFGVASDIAGDYWPEAQQARENLSEARKAPELTPSQVGGISEWLGGVLGNTTTYMGAAIAGGWLGGWAGLGKLGTVMGRAIVGFAAEGEGAYENAIEGGATEKQAQVERVTVGTVNAVIEAAQIEKIFKFAKAGKKMPAFKQNVTQSLLRRALQNGGKVTKEAARLSFDEGFEEFLQESVSLGVPALLRDDYPVKPNGKPDWWRITTQMGDAFAGGAAAGLVYGGSGRVWNQMHKRKYKADLTRAISVFEGLDYDSAKTAAGNIINKLHGRQGSFEQIYDTEIKRERIEKLPAFNEQQLSQQITETQAKVESLKEDGGELHEYNLRRLAILKEGGDRTRLSNLEKEYGVQEDFDPLQEESTQTEEKPAVMDQQYQQEVVSAAQEILTANGVTADIRAVENIDLSDQSSEISDQTKVAAQQARGAFHLDGTGAKVIQLAFAYNESRSPADITTAGHEAYHSLAEMLNDQERAAVAQQFGTDEEAQAEGFGQWLAQQKQSEGQGIVGKAFGKLAEALKRIWQSLKKQGMTYQDVFSGIQKGRLANRSNLESKKGQKYAIEAIETTRTKIERTGNKKVKTALKAVDAYLAKIKFNDSGQMQMPDGIFAKVIDDLVRGFGISQSEAVSRLYQETHKFLSTEKNAEGWLDTVEKIRKSLIEKTKKSSSELSESDLSRIIMIGTKQTTFSPLRQVIRELLEERSAPGGITNAPEGTVVENESIGEQDSIFDIIQVSQGLPLPIRTNVQLSFKRMAAQFKNTSGKLTTPAWPLKGSKRPTGKNKNIIYEIPEDLVFEFFKNKNKDGKPVKFNYQGTVIEIPDSPLTDKQIDKIEQLESEAVKLNIDPFAYVYHNFLKEWAAKLDVKKDPLELYWEEARKMLTQAANKLWEQNQTQKVAENPGLVEKGVGFNKQKGKWQAYVIFPGENKRTHIGFYESKGDALDARKKAFQSKYGQDYSGFDLGSKPRPSAWASYKEEIEHLKNADLSPKIIVRGDGYAKEESYFILENHSKAKYAGKHSAFVFAPGEYPAKPNVEEIIKGKGQKWYEEHKNDQIQIVGRTYYDRDSGRLTHEIYSEGDGQSRHVAEEIYHGVFEIIRETAPERFRAVQEWFTSRAQQSGQSIDEAFAELLSIAELEPEIAAASTLDPKTIKLARDIFAGNVDVNDKIMEKVKDSFDDSRFAIDTIKISDTETSTDTNKFDTNPDIRFQLNDPFARQINKYVNGKLDTSRPVKVSATPSILRMLGANELEMVVPADVIKKAIDKHEISAELLKELPYQLWRPVMVFDSSTVPGSFVVMTELESEGKTVVAAVHLAAKEQQHRVNKIVSVHGRESDSNFIKWYQEGKLRYTDPKKTLDWLRSRGLQLPKEEANRELNKTILFKNDLVKYENTRDIGGQVKFQIDTAPMSALDKSFQKEAESYIGNIYFEGPDRVGAFIEETRQRAESITDADDRFDAAAEIDAAKEAADEMFAANTAVSNAKKGQIRQAQKAAKAAREIAIEAAVRAKAAVDKALYYQQSRPEKIKLREKITNKTYQHLKDAKKLASLIGVPMAERLEQISPKIFQQVLYTEYKIKMGSAMMVRQSAPLLEKLNKLSKNDPAKYGDFSKAWRDGDFVEAEKIAQRFGFADEFAVSKMVLDEIFAKANAVGMEVRYAEGYGPRHIVDMEGLMKAIGGTEIHSRINEAIALQEKQKGRKLEGDERLRVVNSLIRGYSVSGIMLGRPGHAKERGISDTGGDIARFYAKPEAALMHYITEMNEKIAWREFFGRETKELVNLRAQKSRLLTRLNALSGKTKGKVFMLGKGWQELNEVDYSLHISDAKKQLEEVRERIAELDKNVLADSVAKYVAEEYLTPSEIAGSPGKYGEDLAGILQALIEPKAVNNRNLKTLRDLGYITTLANPFSAMTQLKDLGVSAYRDVWGVLPNAVKASVNQGKIKLEDIGVEIFGEELAADSINKAVKNTMEWSGFAWVDRMGKTTYINTVLNKYMRQTAELDNITVSRMQAGTTKKTDVFKRIERFFGPRTGEIIEQLRNGMITDDIKFLAFAELADVQPISMSAMPEGYARAGNMRLMYMMKSFTIRQISWIYRESIRKMGSKATFLEGARNFTQLAITLTAFNIGVEILKDLAKGKEPEDISEIAMDEMLGYLLASRYTVQSVRREGLKGFLEQAIPPTKPFDWIVQGKPEKAVRNVPILGEPYYWWIGAGSD